MEIKGNLLKLKGNLSIKCSKLISNKKILVLMYCICQSLTLTGQYLAVEFYCYYCHYADFINFRIPWQWFGVTSQFKNIFFYFSAKVLIMLFLRNIIYTYIQNKKTKTLFKTFWINKSIPQSENMIWKHASKFF